MALPKRRTSTSRQGNRRSHWRLSSPAWTNCSNCSRPKLAHRACPNCGYYGGKQVIQPREE